MENEKNGDSYSKLKHNGNRSENQQSSVLDTLRNSMRLKGNNRAGALVEEDTDSDPARSPRSSASPEDHRKSMSHMEEAIYLDNCRDTALKSLKNLCKHYADENGQNFTAGNFVQLFSRQSVLEQVFKLFDYSCIGFLKQQDLADMLKQKLSSPKGLEFAELIETVAYVIGDQNDLTVPLFNNTFTSKGVLAKLYKIIDVDNVGFLTTDKIMEFFVQLTNRRSTSEITEDQWKNLEHVFRQRMKDDRHVYLDDFKKLIQTRNTFFAERVFNIFDKDGSGSISLNEFKESVQQFCGKSVDDKARFLFQVYDIDGDGLIEIDELKNVLRACTEENGMKFSEEQLDDLAVALFEDANTDHLKGISYEELKNQLQKHAGLLDNLSIIIDRWLKPAQLDAEPKKVFPFRLSFASLKNNFVFLAFLFCYVGVNVALFVSRAIEFVNEGQNVFFVLAKGAGQTLNFNCMFVLVLMLRQTITFLRVNGCASFLPLDQHVYLHKLCGFFIFFFGMLHTVMHCINFPLNVVPLFKYKYTAEEWLFTMEPGLFGLIPGIANPTGWPLVAILIVMVLCSMPMIRRTGNFEVFYWTHLLYIPFWVLVLLHGPSFWKWFIGPGILFLIERAIRFVRMRMGRGRSYITEGILLPSRVTHLEIKRPPMFHFRPGDYVFVNIPKIAKMEWHPLTISSAPERQDAFSLHIRGVGGWTNKLYDYFEKEQAKINCRSELRETGVSCEGCKKLLQPSRGTFNNLRSTLSVFRSSSDKTKVRHSCRRTIRRPERLPDHATSNQANRHTCAISMPDALEPSSIQYLRSKSAKDSRDVSPNPDRLQTTSLELNYRYLRNRPCVISVSAPVSKESSKQTVTPRISYAPGSERKTSAASVSLSVPHDRVTTAEDEIACKPLEIIIDGPYGAPSSHIFRAEHAVLIAAGIGVTPFASILQSIMHRYWKTKQCCPRCSYAWNAGIPESVMNLRKVDFFWINREQRSFEWFVELLSQLEMEQAELGGAMERFLDMHMYITSALQRTDMKAVGLQLALDLLHQKEKRDLITGLKTRTNAGRPNWSKVFQQLVDQQKGEITVFYCGPPQLGKTLKEKCDEFGFDFRKEIF